MAANPIVDECLSFPGKIAVITMNPSVNEDDFHATDCLTTKYGPEKIVHFTWPDDFVAERYKMIETMGKIAEDKEIKAVLISQQVQSTNAAIDKLKETRDDVFIVCCTIQEPVAESAKRANLIFDLNRMGMSRAMVNQAKKQGAKAFVYYSFHRQISIQSFARARDNVRELCKANGILFTDATALDPTGEAGLAKARQFILDDVPKFVAKYGEDTAFFCTNCQLQVPLIKAVVDCHAIYPQPCCPSPFHGFPQALGLGKGENFADLYHLITEASRVVEEKNMTDRLSTWPVSASMLFINAGAEYAIRWINGEVPKNDIDNRVLTACMKSYIKHAVGEESHVLVDSLTENGITYNNLKLVLMSYLDF